MQLCWRFTTASFFLFYLPQCYAIIYFLPLTNITEVLILNSYPESINGGCLWGAGFSVREIERYISFYCTLLISLDSFSFLS